MRYIGSGPYCYANCLAMVLGGAAPDPAVIEVLTGSPFGVQFVGGNIFFDPPGWNPSTGLEESNAIARVDERQRRRWTA